MDKLKQTLKIFNIEDEAIEGMLRIISQCNCSKEELEKLNDIIVSQHQSRVFDATVYGQYIFNGNPLIEILPDAQKALFKKFCVFAMYSLVQGDFSCIGFLGESFKEFIEKVERNENAEFKGDYEVITFETDGNSKVFNAIPSKTQGLSFEFVI